MTDQIRTACRTCVTPIAWIDCPTGGWWAHDEHPVDEHDAVPAAWVDGDPLMEAVASEVWERCSRDDEDMPQLVCDDPRNIAAVAAAVARAHQAAEQAPATDRAGLSARLWEIAKHHIVAEWICCEPLQAGHDLCAKGYATLDMVEALLVDSPEAWNPNAPLLDAVLSVLPAPTDRAATEERAARWETAALKAGREVDRNALRVYMAVADAEQAELRRMADEAQQDEAHPPYDSWLVELQMDDGHWAVAYPTHDYDKALDRLTRRRTEHPDQQWRLVRETDTFTVVDPKPAVEAQQPTQRNIQCPDAFWLRRPHAPHNWQQGPDTQPVHCRGVAEAQQPKEARS